jgi:hypothetical protein
LTATLAEVTCAPRVVGSCPDIVVSAELVAAPEGRGKDAALIGTVAVFGLTVTVKALSPTTGVVEAGLIAATPFVPSVISTVELVKVTGIEALFGLIDTVKEASEPPGVDVLTDAAVPDEGSWSKAMPTY